MARYKTRYKFSRIRELIRAELASRADHPTAEMVYAALKAEHPTLSLATVYRNLSQLADMRLARRFSLDGVDRFEGHITPHTHVICDNCGRAFDVDLLDMPGINGLYKVAEKQFPGDVARHAIVFYGLCDDCKEEMRRGL